MSRGFHSAASRFGTSGLILALIGLAGGACSLELIPAGEPAAAARTSIQAPYKNSEIVLGASKRFAGAIDSLTWNGREFINSYDHGRELQSAVQFDGAAECFNPTEAGSRDDARGESSTSKLLSIEAKQNTLVTRTQMAFWLAPGETSPACAGKTAAYGQALSDIALTKTVTLGAQGLPNVIEHDVTFHVPSDYRSATFEALTAYLPAGFSDFWTYDPKSGRVTPLSDGPGEQPLPVIMATPDGGFALGVYSPDLPRPRGGYGRFRFDKLSGADNATVKWNCVFREAPVKAGDHRFVCYSIVGTMDDVKSTMARLAAVPRRALR